MGLFMKLLGATVLVLAIFIGSLYSGALVSTGVFSMLDQFEGSRGYFMKGLFPAMHADTAWGFTEDQIPDLEGTTVVVTGANSGLGFWSARHLAAKKATVVLTCRDTKRCEQAVAKIRESIGPEINPSLIPMKLDLASFSSIRAFANAFKNKFTRLDSMILNAGVMVPPFSKTAEGLELQIGTNHFGHFLLTTLLLPMMENSTHNTAAIDDGETTLLSTGGWGGLGGGGPRTIVAVSSAAHFDSYPEGIRSFEEMNDQTSYNRQKAYGQSKLANVLFAQELAERVKEKNILVNAIHPGGVDTELGRYIIELLKDFFGETVSSFVEEHLAPRGGRGLWYPRDASLTQLYAAVSPKLRSQRISGKYYHPIARLTEPDPHCQNKTLQKMLWDMSERVTGYN